ncbi:MAG: hypothetical protein JWQ54_742 [Mucilaginibacter sp.]|nr:hypothetical protein [Mucilaginibacter sp.]
MLKQSYMKKIYLFVTFLLAALLLQNCKKDTVTATATSANLFFAVINDTTWNADTVNASITYNSATKSKIFTCSGIGLNKEINMSVTQNNAPATTGFPLATYNVSTTSDVQMSYYTEQKNSAGADVLAPQGTVGPGSGTIIITAIDSVKKIITGTFSCSTMKNNYDSNGNIVSVYRSQISAGAFNNMPYKLVNN